MTDTAVAVRQEAPAPVAAGETAAIMSMIERMATDASISIERVEQTFAFYQKVQADRARRAYDAAFAKMQPELPEIDKRGKIIIKKKDSEDVIQSTPYALWEDTNKLIKPILAKHGFGLSFRITQTEARLITTAILSHSDGHREETSFSAPIDSTGSKNNVQGWGSSFSYGKRYSGTAILNITTRGEDDDGKAAGAGAVINEAQQATLRELTADFDSDQLAAFCEYFNIKARDELPAKDFDRAVAAIKSPKRAGPRK